MPNLLIKFTIATFLGVSMPSIPTTFLEEQLKFERVNSAYHEKDQVLRSTLATNHISIDKLNLLIVAFKDSDELEVYGKNAEDKSFKKVRSYPICARSGKLGQKHKKGYDRFMQNKQALSFYVKDDGRYELNPL